MRSIGVHLLNFRSGRCDLVPSSWNLCPKRSADGNVDRNGALTVDTEFNGSWDQFRRGMWRDPRLQNERATLHNERPANRAVGSRCARRVGGTGAQSKKEQRSDEHISDSVHTQIPFPEGLELHYARLCRRLIGSPSAFIGHFSATSELSPNAGSESLSEAGKRVI